ncbi:MAG: type II secretion system F family protein [Anaerosomatales bacterium]|nr:type II secretion system F family protein [Anaerosomatales bacterium]MDT8434290.1 type II secretion system F family protein [Anaerosomatales bacterium]
MSRRALTVFLLAIALVATAVAPVSLYAQGLVVQSTDVQAYPTVRMRVVLPPELVSQGEEPTFSVRENSVDIAGVSGRSEAEVRDPVDVVLVVDVSGSMRGRAMVDAKEAALIFIDSMGPRDRIALVAFASDPEVISGFTDDRDLLGDAVASLDATGETALYDAIVRSLDLVGAEAQGDEHYLVVLSDGGDTTSINSLDSASSVVGDAGIPVYAVALETAEYDPESLRVLAARSGGKMAAASDSGEFTGIFEGIAQELLNVYTVTFTGLSPATSELDIELTAANGDLRETARVTVPNPAVQVGSSSDADGPGAFVPPRANQLWMALAATAAFASVGLLVFAVVTILARPQTTLEQLDLYARSGESTLAEAARGGHGESVRSRVIEAVSSLADQRGLTGLVRTKLERAGLPLRPNEYMYFHFLAIVGVGLIVQFATGNLLASAVAVLLVTVLPIALLENAINRRRAHFEEQLPDILSLIAGSLRSGWGIQQALDLVVDEIGEPAAREFKRVQSETRLGLPLEDALARMADRLDSPDFRWTVSAIAIQRDVGGNLAEVLDTVADTIRERAELRRLVSSLTAEGRFSAVVLVILPIFLLVALAVVNSSYISTMFTTGLGLAMLLLGTLLLIAGSVWLARLTKLEV